MLSMSSSPRTVKPAALLVGLVNRSAGFSFARRVQESGVVTLVGQRTGGNLRGPNGGELAWIVSPNNGVSVDIPLISWMPAVEQPDVHYGVIVPDARPIRKVLPSVGATMPVCAPVHRCRVVLKMNRGS